MTKQELFTILKIYKTFGKNTMKVKYPYYITKEQLQETIKLYRFIAIHFSYQHATIFKKLSLAAAYGMMYVHKISYDGFLQEIERYYKEKYKYKDYYHIKNIDLWNLIADTKNNRKDKVFHVYESSIVNYTQEKLMKEIIIALKNNKSLINLKYIDQYYKIIQSL